MNKPKAPAGYNTVNPFIITQDALQLNAFLEKVFGAKEEQQAHTVDTDGLLLHSEVKIGDATVMIAERKPEWPYTPSLLQVYVDDVEKALQVAESNVQSMRRSIVIAPSFWSCCARSSSWLYEGMG